MTLEEQLSEANKKIAALEAQIDSLMLEYCPDEMTKEQFDNWAAHQQPVSLEESRKIDAAISNFLAS